MNVNDMKIINLLPEAGLWYSYTPRYEVRCYHGEDYPSPAETKPDRVMRFNDPGDAIAMAYAFQSDFGRIVIRMM